MVVERRGDSIRVRAAQGKSEGWGNADAFQLGAAAPAAAAPATPAATAPASKQVRVKTRTANLRDSASGRKIATLAGGTVLAVVREEGDWFEVQGAGHKGWLARKVVTVLAAAAAPVLAAAAAPPAPKEKTLGSATVLWNRVNFREQPDGKVLGQVAKGTSLPILGSDDEQRLADVVTGDEQFGTAQPDGPAIQAGEGFLVTTAETSRLAGGQDDR